MSDPKGPTGSENPESAEAAPPAAEEASAAEAPAAEAPASEAGSSEAPPDDGGAIDPRRTKDETPRRKKRKKKKKLESEAEPAPAPLRAELDVNGRERPKFLLKFPEDPELEGLIAAFEAGNYLKVRTEAPRLVERAERAEVKAAASELLRRIEPDPLIKFFLGTAVALFVAVVVYVYYSHG